MENKNDNKDKINLENLEWTTDSKIKETAERLGIFEKPPINSDLNKGSGIDKIPKPKTKAKTVYYKDFIKSRNDNQNDNLIVDAEIIKKTNTVNIPIKDSLNQCGSRTIMKVRNLCKAADGKLRPC